MSLTLDNVSETSKSRLERQVFGRYFSLGTGMDAGLDPFGRDYDPYMALFSVCNFIQTSFNQDADPLIQDELYHKKAGDSVHIYIITDFSEKGYVFEPVIRDAAHTTESKIATLVAANHVAAASGSFQQHPVGGSGGAYLQSGWRQAPLDPADALVQGKVIIQGADALSHAASRLKRNYVQFDNGTFLFGKGDPPVSGNAMGGLQPVLFNGNDS